MFNQYPYLNLNDLNLDYILKAIKEMRYEVTNFVSINAIKYADPIQWNITSQYEKNTIVIDPQTGTAYISVAAVPAGVALTRPEYWTVVFDLGSFVTRAAQNFTTRWESETTTTATFNTPVGGWVVWGDVLYKALVNIAAGDAYVVGSNIEHITIEDVLSAIMQAIANEVQARQDADTALSDRIDNEVQARSDADTALSDRINNEVQARSDADTALQGAINNEVQAREDADTALQRTIENTIGDLANLNTADKSSVVNAINEIVGEITSFDSTEWINVKDYGAKGDGATDDTSSINSAIAELNTRGRGALYFPAGVYKITDALTPVSALSVAIFGAGKAVSIIESHITNGATVFTFAIGADSMSIHDLQFAGTAPSNETWIYYQAGNYSTVYEIKLANVYQFAIVSNGVSGMIVFNIYRVYGWTRGRCILFNAHASGLVISNCNIDNSPQNAANFLDCKNDALYDTIAFYNNHIVGFKNVFVSITEGVTNSNVFIYNNIFDIIYERCVNIGISTGGNFYRVYIEGNWLTSKKANPISIAGPSASQMVKQISICNNKFLEAYWSCATLAFVAGVIITGNQCTTFNNGNVSESAFSIQNSKHIIANSNLIVTQDVGGFGTAAPAFKITNSNCVIVTGNDAAFCAASVFTGNTNEVVANNIGV